MTSYKLLLEAGYLFIELPDGLYVLDTGAPSTFGVNETLTVAGVTLRVSRTFCGLSLEDIAATVGRPVAGILGTDMLNRLDVLIDVPRRKVTFSDVHLDFSGRSIPLEFQIGIPKVRASIGSLPSTLVFDTGAPISYWNDDAIQIYPPEEPFDDSHPACGPFTTQTHRVPICVAGREFAVRSGRMPGPLAAALELAGAKGILGNEILLNAPVAYLARRSRLVVQNEAWHRAEPSGGGDRINTL